MSPLISPKTQLHLEGEAGRRMEAVIKNWILSVPDADPAILEMFRLRDRIPPYENPVPWAGEFIGKYLQSGFQSMRFTKDEGLRKLLGEVITELISTQAEDGYLGPFPRKERLMGQWDLWGHGHVLLALYQWYLETGDQAALEAAKRGADLVCNIYLNTGRRVLDAGSPEMNMAIIHALGTLYLETKNERYLQMVHQIEAEWRLPGAGDYLETALKGIPFYDTPRPRWESLHDLQGLYDLYLISKDPRYKQALLQHWHSIRKTDVHNNGSFSTNEGATGNPFQQGPIETCCTVAWLAYSVDALKLSHDSTVADALELATENAVLGYLHPSGRWSTYSTPMSGHRESSQQTIVFQSHPGTPELNCCSVNAPRGLAILSEWAVLAGEDGFYVNYYGPGSFTFSTSEDGDWTLTQKTQYPVQNKVEIEVTPPQNTTTTLNLRIPEWSKETSVKVNGEAVSGVQAGSYLPIKREWKAGDRIELTLDFSIRWITGDENVGLKSSLFVGPLLLTYDQKFNSFDPGEIPELDSKHLDYTEVPLPECQFKPIRLLQFKGTNGKLLNLCDFATAGAPGTFYESWLPLLNDGPAAFFLKKPAHHCTFPVGAIKLEWGSAGPGVSYDVTVATDPELTKVLFRKEGITSTSVQFTYDQNVSQTLYWNVVAVDSSGQNASFNGPFCVDIDSTFVAQLSTQFNPGDPVINQPLPVTVQNNVVQSSIKVVDGVGIDGSRALVLSGSNGPGPISHIYYKVFDVNIPVTQGSVLRYWFRPDNELGRFMGIDLFFESGQTLRDSGAHDQNNNPMHPGVGRGEVGRWSTYECSLGRVMAGQKITGILFAYDKNAPGGQFQGSIDKIEIWGSNPEGPAMQIPEIIRSKPPQVIEHWASGDEYTQATGDKDLDKLPIRTDIRLAVELGVTSLRHHLNWDHLWCPPLNDPMNRVWHPDRSSGLPELYWGANYLLDGTGAMGPSEKRHPLEMSVSHVVGRAMWATLLAEEVAEIPMEATHYAVLERYTHDMFNNVDSLPSFYDPDSHYERAVIGHDMREGFLSLLAMMRVRNDAWAKETAHRMVMTLTSVTDEQGHLSPQLAEKVWKNNRIRGMGCDATTNGRLVGPLVEYWQFTGDKAAFDLAGRFAHATIRSAYTAEGHFAPIKDSGGHIHSITSSLAGLIQYAIAANDTELLQDCINVMLHGIPEYFSSWGWGDEVMPDHPANLISRGEINQTGDVIRGALYLGAAGHPEFYEMAERYLRGMLLPTQFMREDLEAFLHENPAPKGDWERNILERVIGGYAMQQPNDRMSPGIWPLTTQDIISGGVHALCESLKHRVTGDEKSVRINLFFDTDTADITVDSGLPLQGSIKFTMKTDKTLFVRIPVWIDLKTVKLMVNGNAQKVTVKDGYVEITGLKAKDQGELSFPVPCKKEKETVDGVEYTTTWVGTQVIDIQPYGPISPLPFKREK